MSFDASPPSWKLPTGVNASLWQYAHTPRLAEDEDFYFAGHPLFRADRSALDARFVEPGPLVDLGCGAGRLSLHFAKRGFAVTAVELSQSMLETAKGKVRAEGLSMLGVRANLCDLRCFPDETFTYAISMFSTLGMVRGAEARRKALAESCRVLRPEGRMALHAHNIFLTRHDREGKAWLREQFWKTLRGKPDAGDRRFLYRGIPAMEVHLYLWWELRRDLRRAGFRIDEVVSIDTVTAQPITRPWLLPSLRAGGWIIFASKRRRGRSESDE